MMTSKERIGTLITGRKPDRVPFLCNLLEQGARELGMSIKDYYSSGEHVAEGQIRLRDKYGFDQLWGVHYAANDAEMCGSRNTVFAEDGPPNMGDPVIRNTEDIENLVIDESILETKAYRETEKTIKILKKEKGDECLVFGFVTASYSFAPLLMGIEKWMDLQYDISNRKYVDLFLEKSSQFLGIKVKALQEAGADLICYANPLASASFISPDQFREDALPWLLKDLEKIGTDGIVYFNGGGLIAPVIPDIIKSTKLRTFYLNPFDDYELAYTAGKGESLLAMPINDILLVDADEKTIRKKTRDVINKGKNRGGFILGTLLMPYLIPEKNVKIFCEAAIEYGAF